MADSDDDESDYTAQINIGLWVAQAVLAVYLLSTGLPKLTQPLDSLAGMGLGYLAGLPDLLVKAIGLFDIAMAVLVVVPSAIRRQAWLAPLAAAVLIAAQLGGIVYHGMRGETPETLAMNLMLLALAGFVAWGRRWYIPIGER